MSVRDLFAVPAIAAGTYDYEAANVRSRQLYNAELKKGVELGRKLGRLQGSVRRVRDDITELMAKEVVEFGRDDRDPSLMVLRNIVRTLKGKNKL